MMAANKMQRGDILRATFKASATDATVPNDLFWRPCVPGEAAAPLARGYVAGECVDEAQLREQAEAGRKLMKEQT